MTPAERDALSPRETAVWAAVYARETSYAAPDVAAKRADIVAQDLHAHEHPTEEEQKP